VIYLTIVLSSLHLILEIQVGASGDCVDGFESWEIGALLRRFLIWGVGVCCLTLFLIGLLGCSLRDMLFAGVLKGR
jgi:hypothetical protein